MAAPVRRDTAREKVVCTGREHSRVGKVAASTVTKVFVLSKVPCASGLQPRTPLKLGHPGQYKKHVKVQPETGLSKPQNTFVYLVVAMSRCRYLAHSFVNIHRYIL